MQAVQAMRDMPAMRARAAAHGTACNCGYLMGRKPFCNCLLGDAVPFRFGDGGKIILVGEHMPEPLSRVSSTSSLFSVSSCGTTESGIVASKAKSTKGSSSLAGNFAVAFLRAKKVDGTPFSSEATQLDEALSDSLRWSSELTGGQDRQLKDAECHASCPFANVDRALREQKVKMLWEVYMLYMAKWSGSAGSATPLPRNVYKCIAEFFDPALFDPRTRTIPMESMLDTLRYNFPSPLRALSCSPPRHDNIKCLG